MKHTPPHTRLRLTAAPLLALALLAAPTACDDDQDSAPSPTPTADADLTDTADADATADAAADTAAADVAPDLPPEPSCDGPLFGAPSETTGLGPDACQPMCTCDGAQWTPTPITDALLDDLQARTLTPTLPLLTEDPYASPAPPPAPPGTVCAVVPLQDPGDAYTLQTYPSREAATAAGATPTHGGACGLCS